MSNPGAEKWDERYAKKEFVYGKSANQFVAGIAERIKPGKTLCLAEGEGRNAVHLAGLGHEVTAWDFSAEGLKKCRDLADENGVSVNTEQVDILQAEWPAETWDMIVGIFAHFHEQHREALFRGIKSAVKRSGHVLFELYSQQQLNYKTGGPPVRELLYTPQEVLAAFDDWKIIHFFYGEAERVEGLLHRGTGHVIQLLAQKSNY